MIASRIRELRETLELSMPAFGKKLGCSRDVIANIEYGRSEPKEVFLNHVCDIYGVNRRWLLDGQGPMLDEKAGDEKVHEVAQIFRSLSPDLRELALSQMKSLQKLMIKKEAAQAIHTNNDHLDTIRLMAAMLNTSEFDTLQANVQTSGSVSTGKRIETLMNEKHRSFEYLVQASTLEERELRKILNAGQSTQNGQDAQSGQNIRRDALIAICLALSLNTEEAQQLLTAAGLPSLYAKNRRDAACIFALMKGLDVSGLNGLLAGLEEPIIR